MLSVFNLYPLVIHFLSMLCYSLSICTLNFCNAGAINVVLAALEAYKGSASVLSASCALLDSLANTVPDDKKANSDNGKRGREQV